MLRTSALGRPALPSIGVTPQRATSSRALRSVGHAHVWTEGSAEAGRPAPGAGVRPGGGRLLGPLVSQGLAAVRSLALCPRRSCGPALRSPAGLCWPGLPNLAWSPLSLVDCGLGLPWSGSFTTETLPGKPRVKVGSPGQPASWGTRLGQGPQSACLWGVRQAAQGKHIVLEHLAPPVLGVRWALAWVVLSPSPGARWVLAWGMAPLLLCGCSLLGPPLEAPGSVAAAGSGDRQQGEGRTRDGHGAARQTPQMHEEEIPVPTWAEISP